MLPIPKNVLIHTIEYYEKQDGGRYEGKEKSPIAITNVRIQPSYKIKKSQGNEEKQNASLLVIDCYHSKPQIVPTIGSKVIFEGNEMIVDKIKPIYGVRNIHHYEVDLI